MSTVEPLAAEAEVSPSWVDRATIIGFDIAYAAYGIHLALFILCFNYLWKARKTRPRYAYAWLAYISALFALGSVANGIDMFMSQVIFVDNRNFPAGPGAYTVQSRTDPVNIICTAACVIGGWLQDALLMYRFYIIMSPPWWLTMLPAAIFVVSIVMSCLLLAELTHPGSTIWERSNINIELAYWSSTIATNILLTVLLVSYLMRMRYKVRKALGSTAHLPYLTVSAMLVEAAFLYSAFGLAFLILNAMGNTANVLFFSLLGQLQFITPLMITLRVAQGRAVTKESEAQTVSTVHWQSSTGTAKDSHLHSTLAYAAGGMLFKRSNNGEVASDEMELEDKRELVCVSGDSVPDIVVM